MNTINKRKTIPKIIRAKIVSRYACLVIAVGCLIAALTKISKFWLDITQSDVTTETLAFVSKKQFPYLTVLPFGDLGLDQSQLNLTNDGYTFYTYTTCQLSLVQESKTMSNPFFMYKLGSNVTLKFSHPASVSITPQCLQINLDAFFCQLDDFIDVDFNGSVIVTYWKPIYKECLSDFSGSIINSIIGFPNENTNLLPTQLNMKMFSAFNFLVFIAFIAGCAFFTSIFTVMSLVACAMAIKTHEWKLFCCGCSNPACENVCPTQMCPQTQMVQINNPDGTFYQQQVILQIPQFLPSIPTVCHKFNPRYLQTMMNQNQENPQNYQQLLQNYNFK